MTRASLAWSGSTAGGPEAFSRSHSLAIDGVPATLDLTADVTFGGDGAHLGAEALLLGAVASCQLLSFLNVAARARIEVIGYADEATVVVDRSTRPAVISAIELRPTITTTVAVPRERLDRLVELAHRDCTVANALAVPVRIDATGWVNT